MFFGFSNLYIQRTGQPAFRATDHSGGDLSAVEFFTPENMAALIADVYVQEVRLNLVSTIVCHGLHLPYCSAP